MSMSLTIDRIFKASPERLYEVWTTERHLSQWFGVKVEADPKVGGTIRFHFGEEGGPIQGKFLNLDPYEQIAFTWTQGCDDLKLETTVYVTLKREADGTRLSLRHEGFLDQKSFDEHDEGWLVYMELWALQINSGPSDTKRASIAETFSNKIEVTKSFLN
ncbi:MAG: SRPBCC domain-containing protein [Bdellovibrionales bacterium]|nr:SRPBCC domain-containing protein [Bdellovibrionales bacterium]